MNNTELLIRVALIITGHTIIVIVLTCVFTNLVLNKLEKLGGPR